MNDYRDFQNFAFDRYGDDVFPTTVGRFYAIMERWIGTLGLDAQKATELAERVYRQGTGHDLADAD